MPAFAVEFTSAAQRDLKRLDPRVRSQLLRVAAVLAQDPFPSSNGRVKVLVGLEPRHFRLRVGGYRIIYRVEGRNVIVVRVAHRREACR